MSHKFSIVIPTYNRSVLLKRTLESALAQDGFRDFEVVVVDDCSGDDTWDYLMSVGDPKLKAIRNERRLGMGPNWNKAVRLSIGDYVFLLQDDDLAMPNLLARASDLVEKYRGVDLVCFTTCLINGEGGDKQVLWRPQREQLLPPPQALMYFARHWVLSSTQVIFSRRLFERHGGFDLTPPIMSDAEAILRWMLYADTLLIPDVLALRRVWDGSVTSATRHSAAMLETMRYLADRIGQLAAATNHFDASQLDELLLLLKRTFVEPYRQPAKSTGKLRRLWVSLSSGGGVRG